MTKPKPDYVFNVWGDGAIARVYSNMNALDAAALNKLLCRKKPRIVTHVVKVYLKEDKR